MLAGALLLSLGACDRTDAVTAPSAAQASAGSDSSSLTTNSPTIQSFGVVPITAGMRATVTVVFVMTARCEIVSVSGAITETVFPEGVGGCGNGGLPEQDGLGDVAVIGPAISDGDLTFTSSTSVGSIVTQTGVNSYTVSLYDEYGGDTDDIVLSVVLEDGELTCTPSVERGQQVVCKVNSTSLSVSGWEFNGGGLPTVRESSTSRTWEGPAAVGGTVTAHVTENGAPHAPLTASSTVTDRPSKWPTMQSYRIGPELTAPDAEPGLGVPLGRNCPEVILCVPTRRVQPDPVQVRGAGYTGTEIPSGPNKGYWYVSAATYNMKRIGNVNPAILPGSARTHLLSGSTAWRCRRALGFGPRDAVYANFNRFNEACKGIDMTVFVDAVYGHEGFGYNGGQGHESLAQTAAAEPQNDPYAAIEKLVHPDATTLDNEVYLRVVPIADDITQRAADPNPTGNHPGGTIWFWDGGASRYVQYTIHGF